MLFIVFAVCLFVFMISIVIDSYVPKFENVALASLLIGLSSLILLVILFPIYNIRAEIPVRINFVEDLNKFIEESEIYKDGDDIYYLITEEENGDLKTTYYSFNFGNKEVEIKDNESNDLTVFKVVKQKSEFNEFLTWAKELTYVDKYIVFLPKNCLAFGELENMPDN